MVQTQQIVHIKYVQGTNYTSISYLKKNTRMGKLWHKRIRGERQIKPSANITDQDNIKILIFLGAGRRSMGKI